jgi:hypothetical protein
MCTVTWARQPDGYHLLCNRDERRTRGVASEPRLMRRGGVHFVAPIDSDFGGTWIAVNEHGLTVCLLNGPQSRPAPMKTRRSRGLLLLDLAWASTLDECALFLQQLDLTVYGAFSLLMLAPGEPSIVAEWDGSHLSLDRNADARMPLTSSSFDPDGVHHARLGQFQQRVITGEIIDAATLYDFHTSHGGQASAYSTCMHREDAETVSFSWIVVTRSQIRFQYSPAAPCQWVPSEERILARAG